MMIQYKDIDYKELLNLCQHPNTIVVDVRSISEWQIKHLPGAENLPLDDLCVEDICDLCEDKHLDKNKPINICIYCRSGVRSVKALEYLLDNLPAEKNDQGLNINYFNLKGGLLACS